MRLVLLYFPNNAEAIDGLIACLYNEIWETDFSADISEK